MSWGAVAALCAAAYALKALGFFLAGRVPADAAGRWGLEVVVVPVLAALIVVQTLDGGERLVVDARLPAVLVAALLVRRGAPLLLVVLAAGATAAGLRLAGM
jgi:branched-subunit amino acid transport protein